VGQETGQGHRGLKLEASWDKNTNEYDIFALGYLISLRRKFMDTTSILIRDLPMQTKATLQALAFKHQHSMAEEARQILNRAAARAAKQLEIAETPEQNSLGHRIHARFKVLGGVNLTLPSRDGVRSLPDFSSADYAQR
jgi:plasmid stability protein